MFEDILKAIEARGTVILHRHRMPDGDALGSQIGLKHIILENWPGKRVLMAGDAAWRYAFMTDSAMDDIADADYAGALAIILDTSGRALISDGRWALAADTARIDHHISAGAIAAHEVIDTSYESCCGLITQFALECGLRVPPIAAQSLFTGIVTDSGRFRFDCTTSRTFRLAAFLTQQPIDTERLYRSLYASDYEQVKLRAKFVEKIRRMPRGAAYIYTTREEMAALNADFFSISRGMVSVMNDIRGIDIWANFTESPEGVVCELRSARQDISGVAIRYGGGGHPKACGATVPDRETAMRILDELDEMAGAENE